MHSKVCQGCFAANATGMVQFHGNLKNTFKDMECCTTCGNGYEKISSNVKFVSYILNSEWYYPYGTAVESNRKKKERDGEFCIGACGEFYPMSEPNRADGKFKCYGCRSTDWRN